MVFQPCGTLKGESEVDSSVLLPAKKQKCFPDVHTLPVQQTVDTEEIVCSISTRTLKKIMNFSAFHDVKDEQVEFDGTFRRENIESRKRKIEVSLFDTWYSEQDSSVVSDKKKDNKQASNILSVRYNKIA